MNARTEISVRKDIILNNNGRIMTPDDERIEGIANKYPDQYTNDQEYVEFQQEIGEIIENAQYTEEA